jgi:hypothetical protein
MPEDPAGSPVPEELGMTNSNLVQAAVTVQGTIEASNRGGLKIDGTWYNYPKGFPNEGKLSREVIGSLVTLAVLFGDGLQTPVIGSVLKLGKPEGSSSEAPAPAAPPVAPVPTPKSEPEEPAAPAAAPGASAGGSWMSERISSGQKEKISKLAESLSLSAQAVNLILKMRYKDEAKSIESLTKSEASKLIQFLDSQAPTLPSRSRSA